MSRPTTLLLALALLLAGARTAAASSWQEAFAAERDTVVFFDANGTLLRAPFSLASAETLWAPSRGERLVRVRVSPDGQRVAWLTRAGDRDTTRLWVSDAPDRGLRMRYFALVPRAYGRVYSEPGVPSTMDREVRGGRLVQPNPFMLRPDVNTIEWTPDSRAVVFGYDDGIAAVPADAGAGFVVSRALAVGLDALDPAPIYLVDAIVLRTRTRYFRPDVPGVHPSEMGAPIEGGEPITTTLEPAHPDVVMTKGAEPGEYLLYPLPHRWKVFEASDLAAGRLRAQSAGTVWWAVGSRLSAIRTNDPRPTEEARAASRILWVGYDETRRAVAWAAGTEIARKSEEGGPASVVLRCARPITAALPSRTGARVGLVTGDSLLVWNPADDSVERAALGGLRPTALFETPAGWRVATAGPAPGLAAPDASGRLAPLEVPAVRNGVFTPVSGGARLLLCDPAPRPPATLHVLDVASGRWTTVENPGIAGWEPLAPR